MQEDIAHRSLRERERRGETPLNFRNRQMEWVDIIGLGGCMAGGMESAETLVCFNVALFDPHFQVDVSR